MKKNIIILLIICCSVSILISVVGIVVFSGGDTEGEQEIQSQQLPTPTPSPQPQPQLQTPLLPPPPPQLSAPPVVKGRYVQLKRSDGKDESINILEIEVYNKNGKITQGITPSIYPQHGEVKYFGPQYLIDGLSPSKFPNNDWKLPHTTASKDAFMELDLGSEQEIDRVVIKNRQDCCKDRMVGTELQILDSNAAVKYSFKIQEVKDVYQFFMNS